MIESAMPTKDSKPVNHTCPGCQVMFRGPPDATWCPECRGRTKTITVELGPTQLKHLESLAVIRNTTPEEIMRVAITSLQGRTKTQRLSGAEQELAESLRPSRKRAR